MIFHAFLIKYGEIGIKGKNRYLFEDALIRQMRYALKDVDGTFDIHKSQGRIYVECEGEYDYEETVASLKRVFGIVGICPVVHVEDQGFEQLKKDVVDNYIISVTLGIKKDNPDKRVIIVTKDINMRIKADALGLEVEDYSTDKVDYTELYDGFYEVEVDSKTFGQYEKNGKMDFMDLGREDIIPTPNSFFKLNCKGNILTGRYENGKIKKFLLGDSSPWGLRARNDEQRFAMELLMDENIKVVTLVGGAGTGKTLLAIATGLELVVERKKYKKLLIARPIIPMGKDLGYLPGSEKEKLKPWMQPIFDNIDFLSEAKDDKTGEKVVEGLEAMGILKIEALTYIRGRSIPRGLIIIDEAQNLTPLEIKTIVTRAGENTKIIFTGDPQQIDNPYLDSNTNGLTYLADRLKNEEIVGHITLKKGERSKLAEIAAKLL